MADSARKTLFLSPEKRGKKTKKKKKTEIIDAPAKSSGEGGELIEKCVGAPDKSLDEGASTSSIKTPEKKKYIYGSP